MLKLLFVLVLIMETSRFHVAAANESDEAILGWDDVPALLESIMTPDIPDRVFTVEHFGGVGDGETDDRGAIMAAMQKAAELGGGRVILSGERTWLSQGPLRLLSNVELHIAEGAVLRFSDDPGHYLPQVLTRWEGTELFNYSPFIYAYMATNIAITGGGTIDGNAAESFGTWRRQQRPAQQRLRNMGAEQVPLFERVFGPGDYLRPSMLQFLSCSRVLIEGVTVLDSPFWVVHLVASNDVTVRGITVNSMRLNNDGVDIESTSNVLIEGCHFTTGDDSIVIKAGRDEDGRRLARPSERIVIRNNYMQGHNALAIGSEMSGGVRHVFMEDNQLGAVRSPLYFKSSTLRGGVIEHVYVRNITVEHSSQPLLRLVMDYQGQTDGDHIPIFRHIYLENIQAERVADLFELSGNPDQPMHDIHIRNLCIGAVDLSPEELSAALHIDADAQHLVNSTFADIRIAGEAMEVMIE